MFLKRVNIICWLMAGGLWLLAGHSYSQSVFSSEEELKKQANKFFEEEDFGKAYPLFSQLLSLYPKDAQYNYKFGTCLLFSTNDKEKAIPYISYAAKRQAQDVDKEVFFYLGKAYHLNYRFADAIKNYNFYKSIASSKQTIRYDVDRQIEMCENGKRLLKSVSELSVFEKKDVGISDFFRSYNLSEFNAKLVVKPEDLKTSLDKKKKEESLMYLSPDRDQIYYSSYGEDTKAGKDIYYVTRTAAGDLSNPTRLGDVINTKYDEEYPFLHPNGKTLYFCSKGHNSMGGYDIFKSEWNTASQSWQNPVNMDFAINTPDDDILFISDAEDKTAYFSSRRESADGRITVYKIKLDRKPLDLAIITGTLTKTIGDRMAKATITVTKMLKDEVVGVFNTNAADGSYTLKLPNGGKFMLAVESAGFKKSSELVVVPNQQEIRPMKQEITLVNENGQDKIIIKNDFDAQVDSADLQLAIAYIKSKASLEVSSSEEEISSVAIEEPNSTATTETKTESKSAPVTNTDIIEMAYQDAKETQKDANEMRKNSESAQVLSSQKNEISIQKYQEAQELMKSAEAITNQEEKLAQLDRASVLRKESEMFSKESALSLTLSNQMNELAKAKQQQADDELKYAKDLDNAIKSGAGETKMNELLARKEDLDKKSEELSATFPPDMSKQVQETQVKASKSAAKYLETQQDLEDLQAEAKRLRSEAEKSSNEGVKQNLNEQADEMEKEADAKKKDSETLGATAKQDQAQADSMKNSASLTTSVMKQIQSSPETSTSTVATVPTNTTTPSNIVTETSSNAPPTSTSQPAEASAEEIKSTSTPTTTVTTASYIDQFQEQTRKAESTTKEIDKAETLSVIYQAWTDSLDKQISTLDKQLATTTTESEKTQILSKISELQLSVDDKRQKAADNRNKVDNIKLQEALAAASTVTPPAANTTTPTTSETNAASTATSENSASTKRINDDYENKLKENNAIANAYEQRIKEEKLYQDWAAALFDESQRLKNEGNTPQADAAMNESKAKQALAIQSADEINRIKTEQPELVASANSAAIETTTSETKTESPPPAAATSQTTLQTQTASTPSITVTNTETPEIIPTATGTPASATQSAGSSVNQPSTNVPESIVNKEEYARFISLKSESDWAQKNAERQYKQAADAQKNADEQFKESQNISQQISNTNDPAERQKLQARSDELDKLSLRNQAKADSLKVLAKNSEAESNSKKTESELYLQSLDKASYEEITASAAYRANAETKTEVPVQDTQTSTPIANTATTSITNEPPTTDVRTEATSTVTANEAKTTEPINSNTINTVTNPVASDTSTPTTETATPPVNSETTTVTTETSPSASQANQTTNNTTSSSAKTESVASSAEMIKYYDAIFDKLEVASATYSTAKPIPVDAPMPEGLIFKVQIGAFRNPIPQNLFKGLKPITAETTPQGLKRYTAGLFQKLETANNAKNQVNGLGYRDAFIVAFFNGKRISLNEAMARAKEAGENIDASAINNTDNSAVPSSSSTNTNSQSNSPSATTIANTTDVKAVSGLFYTIQIGVFSRPVNSVQLYNITPLNSERTENGFIRYTTGRFDDEGKAVRAKNNIVQKGISDAFVIAYRDGKRIGLSAAKSILETQGSDVLSKDKQEYTVVPSDTSTTELSGIATNLGIVFKVQVGAFKEQVPIAIANKLLANSKLGIKTFRDVNGLLVYTIGEFLEYESANVLKAQLVSNGLSDAFVIAFRDGKKMTATAALELIKNK